MAPLLLIGLPVLDLVVRGRSEVAVVDANLPTPPASSGTRVIDRVHPSAPAGRVFLVEVAPRHDGAARPPAGAHLQLQLQSAGRTRLLVVQPEAESASRLRALARVLAGDARLQVVDDRQWLDLGALPRDGGPLRVQVIGMLPGTFAFAVPNEPAASATLERVEVSLVPSRTPMATTMPRYRLVTDAPAAAVEVLARATFFVRESPLLLATSLLALASLCAGWWLLPGPHARTAVFLLVAAAVLLHAVLLPPLQGADETSQVGTVEWMVADPSPEREWRYPDSVSLFARALEQDRVQYHVNEPLPGRSADARARLAASLAGATLRVRAADVAPPPAADLQVARLRAPLFFAIWPPLAGTLAQLPAPDRIATYRLIAAFWSLAAFGAGLALLQRAGVPLEYALAYGLAALLPYSIGVAATCSNYAVAIGVGFLCLAGVLAAIRGASPAGRRIGGGVALASAWVGVPVWPDFLALAIAASAIALAAGTWLLLRGVRPAGDGSGARRTLVAAAAGLLLAVVAAAVAWRNFPWFDARLPGIVAGWPRHELVLRAVLLATPPALAAIAIAYGALLRRRPAPARRRAAVGASLVLGVGTLALFAVTPHTEVPFERAFLPLDDLVAAHLAALWSNALAFDQDRLGWKFFFGTFGWHDTFYPEAVYAVARWTAVTFVIALPVLARGAAERRPREAAALLAVSGIAGSLAVATLLARHAMTIHPHGRFILPWLPLIAVPVLALVVSPARRGILRVALRCAVALNVWTAIAVLGARYWVQR